MKSLGNLSKGLVFVLSAPAGTGKTTLVRKLAQEFPCFCESISYTTRPKRKGEIEGSHYHFIDSKTFKKMKDNGDFIETVSLFNHEYGTSKEALNRAQSEGKHIALVIDTFGAMQLMKKLDAVFIFLAPPSIGELTSRLKKRDTERADMVVERLANVKKEMEAIEYYDYVVINKDFDIAYEVIKGILIAEEHKIKAQLPIVRELGLCNHQ